MSRLARTIVLTALAPIAVLVLGQGCGAENALVGGRCGTGLEECDGVCIDPRTDPQHCGGCSSPACPTGVPCIEGFCGGLDGSDGDGSADGSDGSEGDGSEGDGAVIPDGGCTPPFDTDDQCGDCFTACLPTQSCLLQDGGGFACGPKCPLPLVACHGRCVDTTNDPNNCGACGKFCPSQICVSSLCVGTNPGDVVVLGHDFSGGLAGTSQAKALTNAVFIPRTDPLRILSYEQHAEAGAVLRVKNIVQSAAFGRRLSYTVSRSDADLRRADLIRDFDVVLVYDQAQATNAQASAIGAGWAPFLIPFAKAGGVVVALDGAAGNGEMPTLLSTSLLLDTASHAPLAASSQVAVVAPQDRVASQVLSPYAVQSRSITLQPNEPNGGNVVWVVRANAAGDGDPVVVHKIVP